MSTIPSGHCRQLLPNLWIRGIRALGAATLGLCALTVIAIAPPAQAIDLSEGDLRLSLDTTLSHGLTFRVQDQDDLLIGDVNGNDGDLNYGPGLVSNTSKFTTDFDLGYHNFGAFLRLNGFLDFENEHGDRERTPLSDEAKERVGQDIILLDAYLTGAFDIGNVAIDVRLGSHVLNWGESTFIQNGINAINPFDVSKLRLPGSELREGLLPVPMVSASVALTDALTIEGFYQLVWEQTWIDPVGSYFSVTDYAGPGAEKAVVALPDVNVTDTGLGPGSMLGFEPLLPVINMDFSSFRSATQAMLEQDMMLPPGSLAGRVPIPYDQPAIDPEFLTVARGPDRNPSDSGQGGIAFRYFLEALNAAELGFYFVNYHSRLPLLSAHTGTRDGIQSGLAAAGALATPGSAISRVLAEQVTQPVTQAVTQGFVQQITDRVTAAVPEGTPDAAIMQRVDAQLADPATQALIGEEIRRRIGEQVQGGLEGIAGLLAIDRYARTAGYFAEYPEDLQLFGVSFNTEVGATGWALQGEYSFRPDAPLQKAERALFAEGLAPILGALSLADNPTVLSGYLDAYESTYIQGYIERDVSQAQATATKVFGPVLGSDSGVFLTELATMHVHDMPGGKGIPSTNRDGSPNPAFANATPIESPAGEPDDDDYTYTSDADATSWGYRLATRLDYNNAIGAVNLFPYLQFQHDVGGNSPSPSGSFVEGRTAVTLGLRAGYLSRWEADLNFTAYGGKENELHDRDFISATVKYSF